MTEITAVVIIIETDTPAEPPATAASPPADSAAAEKRKQISVSFLSNMIPYFEMTGFAWNYTMCWHNNAELYLHTRKKCIKQ